MRASVASLDKCYGPALWSTRIAAAKLCVEMMDILHDVLLIRFETFFKGMEGESMFVLADRPGRFCRKV